MISRLKPLLGALRSGDLPATEAASIVSTSIVSMALRVAGILLSLLSQLYLARLLGTSEYGRYVIALGWAMILVIAARRGLDSMALRVATHYWEEGRNSDLIELGKRIMDNRLVAHVRQD